MANEDDWRAQRAAKLVGTPFERPQETPRSRVDDTLPIQRTAPEAVSPSAARPQAATGPYSSKPQGSATPIPASKPKPPLAVRGWAIAMALVAVLVGTMAYLFSSGLNAPTPERTAAVQPKAAVAVTAPVVRPVAPPTSSVVQSSAPAASQVASAPAAVEAVTTAVTAPEKSDTVIGSKSAGPAVAQSATAPAHTSRPVEAKSAETRAVARSQVALNERPTASVKHGTTAAERHTAVPERNAAAEHRANAADRRSALADRRPAAADRRVATMQRNEQPENTVFATARKPAAVTPLPPCDLTNRAEAAVCASPALSALRRQVHDLYIGVGTDGDPKLIAKAQREQAGFLKRRDRCKDNACLTRQYTHQIEVLQKLRTKAAAARSRAAAKALPSCAAGQRPSPGVCRPAHHRISLRKLFGIKHA